MAAIKMRLLTAALLFLAILIAGPGWSQEAAPRAESPVQYFRIATGETSATYYAIASEIAAAISNPPGGARCDQGGDCGVSGLLAAALASEGSVQNIRALRDGRVESAFVQADIAHGAQSGGLEWPGATRVPGLRAIAALYPEAIHLVAAAGSDIRQVSDLKGKRVSINVAGSGTRIDAQLVLEAAGLPDDRLILSALSTDEAARQMRAGELDAFFMVGGWPLPALSALAGQTDIRLVPIKGPLADRLKARHPFFRSETLPAGTYPGQDTPVSTLSVSSIWVTMEDQPEQLIHDITRVLWNDYTQARLKRGHPAARAIDRREALNGLSIPLHPGAAKYYRGAGLLKDEPEP